jgi:hypothetical protein
MSILALTSNTLIGTAAAGNIEYASPIFTGTPIGTQRGIIPTQQYYRLDSAYAGSNATGAQSMFGVGVTLSSSTVYEFEVTAAFSKSAGTTSHNFGIGFGGTATLNNIGFSVSGSGQTASFAPLAGAGNVIEQWLTGAGNTNINNTGISAAAYYIYVVMKGTVSINAGGTFIPQYTLSAAPGGAYSTSIGGYININPIGASGSNISVGAWA